MLVVTRKTGETIVIEGDIIIQIIQIRGQKVRVGIDAPKSKKVQRGELISRTPHLKRVILPKTPPVVKTL